MTEEHAVAAPLAEPEAVLLPEPEPEPARVLLHMPVDIRSLSLVVLALRVWSLGLRGRGRTVLTGLSLAGLGEREAACSTYAEVLKKYPNSSNALRQRVATEQAVAHRARVRLEAHDRPHPFVRFDTSTARRSGERVECMLCELRVEGRTAERQHLGHEVGGRG